MASNAMIFVALSCLVVAVKGQGMFGTLTRSRTDVNLSMCEASGAAEIVKPERFITDKFTREQWQRIVDSIRTQNRLEWMKMEAYEEYYHPDAYYEYENFGNFECKDVCRHKRRRVEGAILEMEHRDKDTGLAIKTNHDCYIVGNPFIFYTECADISPDVQRTRYFSPSMQCLPDMVQYREVIMYCPDLIPQCRTRVLELPQACALNEIKCKLPKNDLLTFGADMWNFKK